MLQPPIPHCAGCHRPLPGVESGEMVLGMRGVGIFHGHCKPSRRQRLLHLAHRLLTPRPVGIDGQLGQVNELRSR